MPRDALTVALAACSGSSNPLDIVQPPLCLDLPSPVAATFVLSATHLAPTSSFARSGALSLRVEEDGVATTASVIMDSGATMDLRTDSRVTLSSSAPACIEVIASLDLAATAGYAYRAVGSGCTSAIITATFTLGTWEYNVTAPSVARFK